ncbi:MAG: DUF305 domain-containing protein [Acidobacteria bacterium]|jgi:uncharacterized protein (DUF305 family)|nr:DUF305 domain-containing protein [Acidobacteriota bacterium]
MKRTNTVKVCLIAAGVAVVVGCAGQVSAQVPPAPPVQVVQPGAPGKPSRELSESERPKAVASKHSPADTKFMQGMIGHHAQAVEMVDLLKTRTDREDMRMLGKRIEVSQNDEIKMMRLWLQTRGESIPSEHAHHMPGGMMPGMLTPEEMEKLRAAKGAEFDRLFLEGMIRHHGGALVMVQELQSSPGAMQEAEIHDFATHVDADQRMEILRMNTMLKGIKK